MNSRNITTSVTVAAVITSISIAAASEARCQEAQQPPRIVVSITIDKLTTTQVEKYARLYGDGGFRRCESEGMIWNNAFYTFAPVDRASSIATIVTGTTPYYNGITGIRHFDRSMLQPVDGINGSAASILSSTITDELKMATGGKGLVYSVAGDANTAIITGGHAPDGVIYLDNGHWKATTSNSSSANLKWVNAFNKTSATSSPAADENERLTAVAVQCVQSAGMGIDDICDILAVTYTATDSEDGYATLDKSLSGLMTKIEETAGKGKALFVMAGTGCDNEATADYEAYNIPTGTFNITRAQTLLNMYLGATYGEGKYAEGHFGNEIYLNRKLIEQRQLNETSIEEASAAFIMQLSGVLNVHTRTSILTGKCPDKQVCNGFNIATSGDIIIETAPGWKIVSEELNESYTPRAAVPPFPIAFIGCGISKATTAEPVSADRIAPTIAKQIRIRAPNACKAQPLF